MRFLSFAELLALHREVIRSSGGSHGLREVGALESALAQPAVSFEGRDLYSSLNEKAAALCFSLVANHPFVDGNKRTAHAAMETLLVLNGYELRAPVDDQERVMLALASGEMPRDALVRWLDAHTAPFAR